MTGQAARGHYGARSPGRPERCASARDRYDQLIAAVACRDGATVVVPSLRHFAVDPRRHTAMATALEDVGVVVAAMDDLAGRDDIR